MKSIADGMNELLQSMGADIGKLRRINDNNSHYIEAVRSIWKDPEACRMMLDHTNAFYVRMDDKARRGIPLGEEYPVCEVCIDDPLIRSEMDTHKELLAFSLRTNGLSFEELRIIPARGDMRTHHPFRVDDDESAR